MAKAMTLVGLDGHAAKVVAAILDSETGDGASDHEAGPTNVQPTGIGLVDRVMNTNDLESHPGAWIVGEDLGFG